MTRKTMVYVGTYTESILFGTGEVYQGKGQGIHLYALDLESGALEPSAVVRGVANPSYVAFHPTEAFAFAVSELESWQGQPTGAVSSFAIDRMTGTLTLLNAQPTGGTDPCHVSVHPSGRHVAVSNYMSGSVSVFPVGPDGRLGAATAFVQHAGSSVHPRRQAGPHVHSATFDASGRFLFVADLGMDRLAIYDFDARAGTLAPGKVPWITGRPGAGPRHLVFHPGGTFAYLVNELDCTLTAHAWEPKRGAFREIGTVSTLPSGFTGQNSGAEVQVGGAGRFLYVSNRGHDSIAIFAVDQRTGALTLAGHEPTRGRTPRSFAIDPTGRFLLAANQDTDTIAVFRVDQTTGRLAPVGAPVDAPSPVCIRFAAL